ncbi:LLM class flavin-dependent oxidoreductase [Kibdelosporangium persicum]|uniref:Luciferase-like domain-containing protein n=1 Tax=Kibdelosporangium persicum TaxID=2698649 RepID=A0ABX2FHF4_9PSEU|nr:LLM class flavin-dependent oxidoreductase [Kibdelosporangium persicum]NRN70170.1 hypothetical protein [Kibdelosporangium persicum]
MRIGLGVDEMGPSLETVIDQMRAAATAGLAGVWLAQRTGRDALTTLAVAGRQVPGIELGTAVVPTYPRHPLAPAAGSKVPRVVAATVACVTSHGDDRRAWVAEHFGMVGQMPSYRAMLDRGRASGPEDAVLIGDETTVEHQISQLFDAGATELVVMPLGRKRNRPGRSGF